MRFLTIILFIALILYVAIRKRKFDFFSIASFSFVLYYFPVFIGHLKNNDTGATVFISNKTFLCIFCFGLILLIFMAFYDKYYVKRAGIKTKTIVTKKLSQTTDLSNFCILILSIIGIILMVITIVHYGSVGNNFNKMKLLMNANRFTEYMKYIGLFTFVYSFIFKGKFIIMCRINSLLIIFYTFLLGHRSFAVIGIISIFMHIVGTKQPVRLVEIIRKNKQKFILIFIFLLFFLFVKNIFAAFMSGRYDLVVSRLSSKEYYINTLLESESNIIMNNLNNVVIYNFKYSFYDYTAGIVSLIPLVGGRLLNALNYISFEDKMNYTFNAHYNEGIGWGSNYLGEAYSIGNIYFLILITFLTLFFIKFLILKKNNTSNPFIYTFLCLILTYFTFYIHRNSLLFLLTTTRAYIYILVLLFIIHSALRIRNNRSKQYEK